MKEKLYSTDEIAKRMKRTPQLVRQLIRAGRLRATRLGRDWIVSESDYRAFEPRSPGRPKKA